MRTLLLTSVVLLLLFQVIPGKHPILRCMGNTGVCRPSCKKNEQPYYYCRNYQPCCLQSYMRISITGAEGNNDWSYGNHWPKIP
ncbi:beta-defensin 119 [Fukomys damarensis]|uniref:beta-defensin 119 n=1 Tax=Fukomys damarensis TaxID=885580 RepID=UPI0005401F0A|nr:beta-defensin 119 [Fukomys damarensis]